MLRKIVVDDKRVALAVAKVLAHRASRVRCYVLHRCRLRGRSGNDDGVVHRAVVGKNLYYLRNRRPLLPNRAVNANEIVAFVVDDRVDRDRSLSCLAIADYQLALAAANWNHAVDGLEPS